jgi:hypothetical protein
MNILIIGNGFDKAFGLPTNYTDFLAFTEAIEKKKSSFENAGKTNPINLTEKQKAGFETLIKDNKLLHYFNAISKDTTINYDSPNWIDFEEEIKFIIKTLDECYTKENSEHYKYMPLELPEFRNKMPYGEDLILKNYHFLMMMFDRNVYDPVQFNEKWIYNYGIYKFMSDKKKIISLIYDSFCEFCKLFEMYCSEYIDKMNLPTGQGFDNYYNDNINLKPKDLLERLRGFSSDILPLWGFDSVLSFNYTSTYKRMYVDNQLLRSTVTRYKYGEQKDPGICYIHGKAGENNIIIGIDEYLDEEKRDIDFDFIDFKKYYQRIDKKTGSTYRDWLKTPGTKNVYYIGHSFAETDYDILREFLMNDDVKNTILYHIPERKKELIQRVINIIGQDELINRVHGADWTIRFEPQEEFLFSEKNTVFVNSLRSSERQLVTL